MKTGSIQIKDATGDIEFGAFLKILEHYRLVPDWWLDYPELALAAHQARIYFRILRRDQAIGYVWVDGLLKGHGCELGILVVKEERKKWVPGDLQWFQELFEFIFDKLDVPRISVSFEAHRKSAERFFKALGFRYEGTKPDALRVRGKYKRTILLGLLRRDFETNKEAENAVAVGIACSQVGGRRSGDEDGRGTAGGRGLVPVELPVSGQGSGSPDCGGRQEPDHATAGTVGV